MHVETPKRVCSTWAGNFAYLFHVLRQAPGIGTGIQSTSTGTNGHVKLSAQGMLLYSGVTPGSTPPAPFPNSLKARAQCLGPHGRSRGRPPPGKLDPKTCRAAGSRAAPLSPIILSPPLPPPFQPPGFKVKVGGCRGPGCHLSVPFTDSSMLWGFWLT